MNINPEIITMTLSLIGALVIAVQVTVEVIKRFPVLNKIPTDAIVIVLSIAYSEMALAVWGSVTGTSLRWFTYVGMALGGLFVAYVAMFGWKQLSELVKRFRG